MNEARRISLRHAAAAALLLALGLPSTPWAADARSDALARFQQAAAGDAAAADDAAERLLALSARTPGDPVLRAYAGAATAMRALHTPWPWRKLSLAEDGLALLDKALAQLSEAHDVPGPQGIPATLETRFVAASTFLAVPGFMNRRERGRHLLDEVRGSPLLARAPEAFRNAVLQRVGEAGLAVATGAGR